METTMRNQILIVDDEPNVLSALQRVFLDEPYDVRTAESGEEGLELFVSEHFKVVISDERMPGMDGAEFLSIVKERHPEVARILLTGYASLEATMKAVNDGEIYRFFTKPWDEYQLKLAIRSAIEKYDLEAENRRLLKTVKRQAVELRSLEVKYPGITRVQKTGSGTLIIPEIAEEELEKIIEECTKECA
jgi:two-component system, probable response regulator PhcQ